MLADDHLDIGDGPVVKEAAPIPARPASGLSFQLAGQALPST